MRQYCSVCHYPESTCVCDAVRPVDSPVIISVLQHPKEASHAKNTARLIALSVANTIVIRSSDNTQVEELRQRCLTLPTVVIYPNAQSRSWEQCSASLSETRHMVVLDGSWRQAFGLWQRFDWLSSLPAYHFSSAPDSRYAIRHTQDAAHLSTLEAVAYALHSGFGTNVQGLYDLQQQMQKLWQGPAAHRR